MKTLLESILSKHKVSSSAVGDASKLDAIIDLYCDVTTNNKPRNSQRWIDCRRKFEDKWFSVSGNVLMYKIPHNYGLLLDFIQQAHEQYGINTIKFTKSSGYMQAYVLWPEHKKNSTIDGIRFEIADPIKFNSITPVNFTNCTFVGNCQDSEPTEQNSSVIWLQNDVTFFRNCKFENICFLSKLVPLEIQVDRCDFNDKSIIKISLSPQQTHKNARSLFWGLESLGLIDSNGNKKIHWSLAREEGGTTYVLDSKKSYKDFTDLILPNNNVSQQSSIILGFGSNVLYITKHRPSFRVLTYSSYKKIQLHDGTWVYEK